MVSPNSNSSACTSEHLWASAERFLQWLDRHGYASYDPYDIWGTAYGKLSRRLYYARNPLGKLLIAPVILGEILCPSYRTLFVKKARFATADSQLLLAFLNLHRIARQIADLEIQPSKRIADAFKNGAAARWLARAETMSQDLLKISIPGYGGHCWGYPFDWQNVNGLMPKGTPHVTATPYCYEGFVQLHELTGKAEYLEIARSIAAFICHDLKDTPTGPNAAASSYSPLDCGKVVNASAYRVYVLFDAARRFGNAKYLEKAQRNLNFILESQRADGAWLYALDNPGEAFIDHFHTCFVIKNLYKTNLQLRDPRVTRAVVSGFAYYRRELFDSKSLPRMYAIEPRKQISRLELYNFAEAITLCVLLRDLVADAYPLAEHLGAYVCQHVQVSGGTFITRLYRGGFKHRFPYMRWSQAQMFLALSILLQASVNRPGQGRN